MTDNVIFLRIAANFPCDPRHKQLLLESADEIERLRTAVALAVYELNFVAAEHDCEQCATVAKNIASVSRTALEGK
jgi:hypothetical protein